MWIEYHQELRDHLKVSRLATALTIPYTDALGLLSCLWLWAASNAPDGNLKNLSDPELSHACRCEGRFDGRKLRHAFVSAGLIDRSGTIHKWKEYGIKYLASARERKAKWKASQVTLPEHSKNVPGTATVPTVPYRSTKVLKDGLTATELRTKDALKTFMAYLTHKLSKCTGASQPSAVKRVYGQVIGWLKTHPEDIPVLSQDIDRLPVEHDNGKSPTVDWYVSAIQALIQRRQHEQIKSVERLTATIGKPA